MEERGHDSKEEATSDQSEKVDQKEKVGGEAGKVYIVPTLQLNVIKYREDENFFLTMLRDFLLANNDVRLKLATGYLNL